MSEGVARDIGVSLGGIGSMAMTTSNLGLACAQTMIAWTMIAACAHDARPAAAPRPQFARAPDMAPAASAATVVVLEPMPSIAADGTCPPGYRPREGRCEDLDECAAVATPCGALSATCTNTVGGYACGCPRGFMGGGPSGFACVPRVDVGGLGTNVIPETGGLWNFGAPPYPLLAPEPNSGLATSPPARAARIEGADDLVVVAGSGGSVYCVLHSDGHVSCWGRNESGQLGDGTLSPLRETRETVQGLADVVALDADGLTACAIVRGGALYCWGNALPSDTDRARVASHRPVRIPIDDVVQVSVASHVCALRRTGTVACWGSGWEGWWRGGSERGVVDVAGLTDVVQVASGLVSTTAITRSGEVVFWGSVQFSPLRGTYITPAEREAVYERSRRSDRRTVYVRPIVVDGIAHAIALGGGSGATCVLTRDAGVVCWGPAMHREPGRLTSVPNTEGAIALSCDGHCAMIGASGELGFWGGLAFTPFLERRVTSTPEISARWRIFEQRP